MRLLADENLPEPMVVALRNASHAVAWVFEDSRGVADIAVIARARAEDRIVITFDTDFGDIIFRDRVPPPPGVILLRLPSALNWDLMAGIVVAALSAPVDWRGNFAVIDERRIRQTALPEPML